MNERCISARCQKRRPYDLVTAAAARGMDSHRRFGYRIEQDMAAGWAVAIRQGKGEEMGRTSGNVASAEQSLYSAEVYLLRRVLRANMEGVHILVDNKSVVNGHAKRVEEAQQHNGIWLPRYMAEPWMETRLYTTAQNSVSVQCISSHAKRMGEWVCETGTSEEICRDSNSVADKNAGKQSEAQSKRCQYNSTQSLT